jgi:hypothetical protein
MSSALGRRPAVYLRSVSPILLDAVTVLKSNIKCNFELNAALYSASATV